MSIFHEDDEDKPKKIGIKEKQNISFYVRGDIAILIDRKRGDYNRGIWLTRLLEKRFPKDLEQIRKELGIKSQNWSPA